VTVTEVWHDRTGVGDGAPGVADGRGDKEIVATEGGDDGPERSNVGAFGKSVGDHVRGEGENGIVTGTAQTKESGGGSSSSGVRDGIKSLGGDGVFEGKSQVFAVFVVRNDWIVEGERGNGGNGEGET